jgi:hypothetical protein
MRVLTRALATLGLAALAGATSLSAQNAGVGSYRFYVGASGGVMDFATTAQTRGGIGMAGANMLVTASRVGLMLAVDAGLGSGETAAFNDPVDGTIRIATFDHIMRYYFEMMAYPLKSHIQPFIGVGFGIQTLTNLQVQGSFTDDVTRQANYNRASELGSTGFAQAVAGVDIRVGVLDVFGSISAATGSNGGADLIQGAVYTGQAGIRFNLGKSREDVD